MTTQTRHAVIGRNLAVQGTIRNATMVEIWGIVDGAILADHVVIHPGGQVKGRVEAGAADVQGLLDGKVRIRNLINIGSSGSVRGDVRYGGLSLAMGGSLSGEVRNVPPELGGDFELMVRQGQSVRVTTADLCATDAEDDDSELVYTVSNMEQGFLALASAPEQAVQTFTQGEISSGAVLFVHQGDGVEPGGFDVVVTDSQGATTGAPRHVSVAVVG
ncbi:MAG: polymer-forming cytoskeletal protein [Hyphomicrobiaceae bacterium]